ncbi:prolyl aminopeptidase [Falsochrobactrum shanghaiense]|uniref:Proline iminopeptidase n=1 Tax=Falsochrobactrum shanghaiense TaxID=2201899 RepID=A0A316JF27_9HYPH|nr:prolyl aminopeptidase [Falsochrobactrum shanghaiense]PWL19205.1 prolyl aminopeptidase [Falsochrobactrum shanghaiense]
MTRNTLYPETQPFKEEMLQVSALHHIYVEQCGNPDGKPVIMIHGGPGGGITPAMRRLHDPELYRIILFDQRGCGRSTPHAELRENTTWDLVADIEHIRAHLGIDKWQVFGGSWGSTLGLAYAQTHPERVAELVLRGIFMIRRFEVDWMYSNGASIIFPDHFEAYQEHIPEDERGDMIAAYYKRLTDPDPQVQLEAARRWARWEGSVLSIEPDPARVDAFGEDLYAVAFARIECHYFQNRGFLESDDQLLRNVERIRQIPGVIVHGRYDMCTPFINAWQLKKMWPEADLRIVEDGGHAVTEPGITHELIEATRRFAA